MRVTFVRHGLSGLTVALILGLTAASPAGAQSGTLAPPGNSAIGQYLEVIPSASGSTPTNRLHRSVGHAQAGGGAGAGPTSGSGGGSAGSGSGGSSSDASVGSSISSSTSRALKAKGPAGSADAAFAGSTAPGSTSGGANQSAPSGGSVSPASSVLKSLTGSSSGGGLGALLPAILAVALVAGGSLAILRRRRASS